MPAWYAAAGIDITSTTVEDNHGCAGKIGYPNRDLAIMARAKLNRRGVRGPLDTYCCPRCGKFHLGRNPKKRAIPKAQQTR